MIDPALDPLDVRPPGVAEQPVPDADETARPLVLVTGSAGLIGTRLIDALASKYRVVGLDIKPPLDENPQAAWLECDL
ncbi:MAG: NAD-dependent epimerase/dehydratase family protein, partial [Pirellulaceae bacterium]